MKSRAQTPYAVGARLPATAVCHSTSRCQTRRGRGQARSYGNWGGHAVGNDAKTRSSTACRRGRPQDRPAGKPGCYGLSNTPQTCRSALARDGGVSSNIAVSDPAPSRASALLRDASSQVAYCATPLPNDQFSLRTSTRLMKTSSSLTPATSFRRWAMAWYRAFF